MWTRIFAALLMAGCAWAQTPGSSTSPQSAAPAEAGKAAASAPARITIPSGTKVPLSLKQAISTRNAQEGDPVYCETTFPFVIDDRIVIPAGTSIQGKSSGVTGP